MTKIVSLPHPQVNTFGDGVGYKGLVLRLRNSITHPVTLIIFIALPPFRNALLNLTQKRLPNTLGNLRLQRSHVETILRSIRCLIWAGAFANFLVAVPVWAHHSFAAQYDRQKSVTLKGKVTKVEWANPHVYFYIDVTGDGGAVATWAVENGPPTSLFREGWRKDTLKPGDLVTVEGFRAKDGSNTANARSVVLSDGRKVFAGSSGDGDPSTSGKQ